MDLDAAHQHDERPQHGGADHRHIDAGGALGPDEAGHELVEPAHIEDDDADHRRRGHEQHLVEAVRHVELAQAQRIGRPQREGQHHDVVDDQSRPLEPARTLDQPYGKLH